MVPTSPQHTDEVKEPAGAAAPPADGGREAGAEREYAARPTTAPTACASPASQHQEGPAEQCTAGNPTTLAACRRCTTGSAQNICSPGVCSDRTRVSG